MDVTNTYDNKFYTIVLRVFLKMLDIIRGEPLSESQRYDTHANIVDFIKGHRYKLLQETSNLTNRFEACSQVKKNAIYELKKEHFHKFNSEKELYKYCLKSREIKIFLNVMWSVFYYHEA